MTQIYPILIEKLRESIEAVDNIKEVFSYPQNNITKFPACVFFPVSMDNNYETNQENFKTYTFAIFITVGGIQKNVDSIYTTIMPKTVDAFLAQIDSDWDIDTIDGHRAWAKITTGDWSSSNEEGSLEVTAQFNLEVKLLTNN